MYITVTSFYSKSPYILRTDIYVKDDLHYLQTANCVTSHLLCRLKWLSAALHTIAVRNNNLHEGTLQPARRSNLQAVEKSVTLPNQTARSFFVIIIVIIYASTSILSHHHTSFVLLLLVLLQTSPISLLDTFFSSLISHT